MKMTNNTVLITGGTSGIGLEMAKYFFSRGNKVIICGSRQENIERVCADFNGMDGIQADLSKQAERERMCQWVLEYYPQINVLVNNAGIQLRGRIQEDTQPWSAHSQEIALNLEAPIHLSMLLEPHLRGRESTIINVSSGLALTPACFAPVYCATKAGIHTWTRLLRKELANTLTTVVEIIPPAVDTPLGGADVHAGSVDATVFVTSVLDRIANGETEVGYGTSEVNRLATREELEERFNALNS